MHTLNEPTPHGRRRPPSPVITAAVSSAIFLAAYWLANHLTGLRSDIGAAVFDWERHIPFVPWTIVPYLSLCGFFPLSFVAGRDPADLGRHVTRLSLVLLGALVCYAVFPLRFMFDRPAVEGVFGPFYGALTTFDLPYNRAPSLHIAVLVLLWVSFMPRLAGLRKRCLQGWFLLIGVSVLTTYQHHVVDVLAGLALGAGVVALTPPRRRPAGPLKETPGRPTFPCPPRGAGWAQPGPGGRQKVLRRPTNSARGAPGATNTASVSTPV